jgi:hypothetical protein
MLAALRGDHDHRAACVQHRGVAHRPQQELGEAPTPPGSDHQQVGVGRQRNQRLGRVPVVHHHALHLHAADRLVHLLQQRVEQLVGLAAVGSSMRVRSWRLAVSSCCGGSAAAPMVLAGSACWDGK